MLDAGRSRDSQPQLISYHLDSCVFTPRGSTASKNSLSDQSIMLCTTSASCFARKGGTAVDVSHLLDGVLLLAVFREVSANMRVRNSPQSQRIVEISCNIFDLFEQNPLYLFLLTQGDAFLADFKQHSLKNPIVEQVVTETLRTVRDIWTHFGNGSEHFFTEIHIELGREMKNSAKKREQLSKRNSINENTNYRIKEVLKEICSKMPCYRNNYNLKDFHSHGTQANIETIFLFKMPNGRKSH